MSLGAYFGSTKITQGAAGLGQDGPLFAYADGSVGGNADASTPGALFAYRDGSLGEAPLQAYSDGSVGGNSEDPDSPGPLFAYHDGVFGGRGRGAHYASLEDPSGGPAGMTAGSGGGSDEMADMPGPVFAYHDGVLGSRGGLNGLGEYFSGVGAAAAVATLDLGDAATLAEVKSIMARYASGYALSTEAQKVYTPDWYTSGIWDVSATALWQAVIAALPQMQGQNVSTEAGSQMFPNANGLGILVGLLSAPATGGADYMKTAVPTVFAWFAAGGGPVLPPYLSLADKTREERAGSGGMQMSSMAMYGLGAVALLGIALVWRRRK